MWKAVCAVGWWRSSGILRVTMVNPPVPSQTQPTGRGEGVGLCLSLCNTKTVLAGLQAKHFSGTATQ